MNEFRPGLEGVVAFETEIAEPDREGGALRYRGVDIEELVGVTSRTSRSGACSSTTASSPGCPLRGRTRRRPDRQRAGRPPGRDRARCPATGAWGSSSTSPTRQARDDLARLSAADDVDRRAVGARSTTVASRSRRRRRGGRDLGRAFLLRWRGEADPRHVKAIDRYWVCGRRARRQRVDLHGADRRVHRRRCRRCHVRGRRRAERAASRRRADARAPDARRGGRPRATPRATSRSCSTAASDHGLRPPGLPGGGSALADAHARPREELESPRVEVAEALEQAALAELAARHPERVLATNVEFWSAVVLDIAEIPPALVPAMFAGCAGRRLVGAHPRAEAKRQAHPALGPLRRARRPAPWRRLTELAEAVARSRAS